MDYYINPAWFYWLSVFGGLKTLSIVVAIFSFIIVITLIICYFVEYDFNNNEHYLTICKRWILLCFVVCISSMLIAVFVPDKQTMIEMQVATVATKTNLEWTVEQLNVKVLPMSRTIEFSTLENIRQSW